MVIAKLALLPDSGAPRGVDYRWSYIMVLYCDNWWRSIFRLDPMFFFGFYAFSCVSAVQRCPLYGVIHEQCSFLYILVHYSSTLSLIILLNFLLSPTKRSTYIERNVFQCRCILHVSGLRPVGRDSIMYPINFKMKSRKVFCLKFKKINIIICVYILLLL